ncbi:MAG: HEAT repeat domain-containing protein [Thermoplasmata archaeon]|nr:HEAT repeat domain-containing protein [Thermoplasmata archaeon]
MGAASARGALGRQVSRGALESTLEDPDWRVRAQGAYALSRLHNSKSTLALMRVLARDESALVRNACALALGRIGDPRAVPVLERALDDESDRVRREAVLAIERSHDPEAAAKVRRFLHDPARRVRIVASVVMGLRRDRDGVGILLKYLGRSDQWEKPALLVALGRIGTPDCGEALARSADDRAIWVRVCALHGLAEMRSPLGRTVALARIGDPSWAVRGAAALALGQVGTPGDSEALIPLLGDSGSWVRRGAVYALGQLGARKAAAEIRAALDDPDPEVRLAAIWALGRLRDPASTTRLIELLGVAEPQEDSARPLLVEGDGAVRLVSDADARWFDALVEAVASHASGRTDSPAHEALSRARGRLTKKELDRLARLPTPLGPGEGSRTLRSLFDLPGLPAESGPS